MADTLSAAIHNKFQQSSALVSAISGGLWTGEVPEGSRSPYAWLEIAGIDSIPLIGIDEFEYARFIVHIYGPGAETVEAAAFLFKDAFDYKDLFFSTRACISVQPLSYRLLSESLRSASGVLMFRAVLLYRVHIQNPKSY